MASSINASTAGGGGVITTADSSGNLNIQSGGSTVVAVTSAGVAVTGTLAATGAITGSSTVAGSTGILYPLTSSTAVTLTTQTSVDFTSIPSWVKRITVMFSAVSTNGSSIPQIQLGSTTFATSGYIGASFISASATSPAGTVNSAGFLIGGNSGSGYSRTGTMTINLLTGNTWASSHTLGDNVNNYTYWGGGSIALGGTLDRVRLTTVNGTDTFDAGSVNLLYE